MPETYAVTNIALEVASALGRLKVEAGVDSDEEALKSHLPVAQLREWWARALQVDEANIDRRARSILAAVDDLQSAFRFAGMVEEAKDVEDERPVLLGLLGPVATSKLVRGVTLPSRQYIRRWESIGFKWETFSGVERFVNAADAAKQTEALRLLHGEIADLGEADIAKHARARLLLRIGQLIDALEGSLAGMTRAEEAAEAATGAVVFAAAGARSEAAKKVLGKAFGVIAAATVVFNSPAAIAQSAEFYAEVAEQVHHIVLGASNGDEGPKALPAPLPPGQGES